MKLADLIRKREPDVANANPANSAKTGQEGAGSLATLATLALANPPETKPAPMTAEEEKSIRAWLDYYRERDPAMIEGLLEECQRDLKARHYYLARWDEIQDDKHVGVSIKV